MKVSILKTNTGEKRKKEKYLFCDLCTKVQSPKALSTEGANILIWSSPVLFHLRLGKGAIFSLLTAPETIALG